VGGEVTKGRVRGLGLRPSFAFLGGWPILLGLATVTNTLGAPFLRSLRRAGITNAESCEATQYETYQFDGNNNLAGKTDRNGNSINYSYDHQNRLNYKQDPGLVYYTYDPAGRLTQVEDYNSGSRAEYDFAFDNMNRLTSTTTNYEFTSIGAQTVQYAYDAASNRVSMTDPQSTQTSYAYDNLNRLTSLSNSWAGTFGFSYDALSRRTQLTRPNGVNTNYSYDNLSRLLSVLHQAGSETLDGATYTYDAAGNRLSKNDLYANTTSNYAYDAIYQLLQVTQGTSTTESYTYDIVGNRLSSLGLSTYQYNSSNELTSTPLGSYTYDHNGNTLIDAQGRSYSWDPENRLTQAVMPERTAQRRPSNTIPSDDASKNPARSARPTICMTA
jgi:YD repeat-containing protein